MLPRHVIRLRLAQAVVRGAGRLVLGWATMRATLHHREGGAGGGTCLHTWLGGGRQVCMYGGEGGE